MLRLIVGVALGLGAYVGALQAQSCPPPHLTDTTVGWTSTTPVDGVVKATTSALSPCYAGWSVSALISQGSLVIHGVPNGKVTLTVTFTPTGAAKPLQTIVILLNWPGAPVRLTPDAPGPIVIT